MKPVINIINQIFEIEKKLPASGIVNVQRNIERMKAELSEMGYSFHNPLHEKWDEMRTDCEASISGTLKSRMLITEVLKPIVHYTENGGKKLVQKAVVVVE